MKIFLIVLISISILPVFAQESNEKSDYTLYALIGTWVGIGIAIAGTILSNQKASDALNQNKVVANNALMAEILDRFSQIMNREESLIELDPSKESNGTKFDRYASDYLNHVDRLLYIQEKNMIPKDTFDYFKFFIDYAKQHYDWKVNMHDENYAKEGWKIIYDYFQKNPSSDSRKLPKSMTDYLETHKKSN